MTSTYIVTAQQAGQRLDVFCVSSLPGRSRAAIQRAIVDGLITVNGSTVKRRHVVREGDKVQARMEELPERAVPTAQALDFAIPILYETKDILVIDKPAGISVHPPEHATNEPTIMDWFLSRYTGPGIVHRLDKDTSGVLVLTKTQQAFDHLKEQFKQHRVRKEYLALVHGVPGEPKGRINRPLARSPRNPMRRMVDPAGKLAITEWVLEEKFGNEFALLRVFPLTGRTHQIRVHLHFLGFPLVGDALYTYKRKRQPEGVKRQMLHAEKIAIRLPDGKRKTFTAPLPEDFVYPLSLLRRGKG